MPSSSPQCSFGALLLQQFLDTAGEFPLSKSLTGNGKLLLLMEPMLLLPDSEPLSDESESEELTVSSFFFFGSNLVAFC
jgi:hypothetical protein